MLGRLVLLIGVGLMVGCKAPPPSLNPFAGYGSPRVPPPATGAAKDPYFSGGTTSNGASAGYQQPGQSNYATADVRNNPSFAAPSSTTGGTLNWRGKDGSASSISQPVGEASGTHSNPSLGPSGPLNPGVSSSGSFQNQAPASNSLNLTGMAVNDGFNAPVAPVDARLQTPANMSTTTTAGFEQPVFVQPPATQQTAPVNNGVPSLFNQPASAPLKWGG